MAGCAYLAPSLSFPGPATFAEAWQGRLLCACRRVCVLPTSACAHMLTSSLWGVAASRNPQQAFGLDSNFPGEPDQPQHSKPWQLLLCHHFPTDPCLPHFIQCHHCHRHSQPQPLISSAFPLNPLAATIIIPPPPLNHSHNKHLLGIYIVPDTAPGTWIASLSKTDNAFIELTF